MGGRSTEAGTPGAGDDGEADAGDRWVTVLGELSGAEVDSACAAMGVPAGPERRRWWQRLGLFPLPAVTAPAGAVGGRGPAYHRDAPALAAFLHAMGADGGARPDPDAVARVAATIRLLRLRAGDRRGPEAAEDRFHAMVGDAMRSLAARRARATGDPGETSRHTRRTAGRPTSPPPRWITVAGSLSAREIEAACAARGVRLDRARRTYWQSERVFPQPERRLLRPPEGRGARGYYHSGAVDLACLIDYVVRADHPAKAESWRCTVRGLAPVLTGWRAEAGRAAAGGAAAEDAFHARIGELMALVRDGAPIPGVEPRHRDVLPPDQHRVDVDAHDSALRATAQVAQAIVDEWVSDHAGEPAPERLVVWFRLERAGPEIWRIADAGARRTSHESQRARAREDAPVDDATGSPSGNGGLGGPRPRPAEPPAVGRA